MWLLLLLACGGAPCHSNAEPQVGVMTSLVFSRAGDDGVSDGFDLDGDVSGEGGATGCGIGDYTAPNGTTGVDNGFARLLPALELTEAQAVEGIIQEQIDSGGLLMMFQLFGLDDADDDECVGVEVDRGQGTPMLGTDGTIETDQTFERDPDVPAALVEDGVASAGSVSARPFEWEIPLSIFGNDFAFVLHDGALRVDVLDDGTYAGVLAGGTDIDDLIAIGSLPNVDEAIAPLLDTLVRENADLAPDDGGVCQQIAVTFQFTAEPAFFYPDGEGE